MTIQHYNKSKVGFGVGGGLFALGLLYTLLRQENSVVEPQRYSLSPYYKMNQAGLSVTFNLNQ